MAITVSRINGIDSLQQLLKRPRVSARISEYIIAYVNANILVPLKIMQSDKFDYSLTLDFDNYIPGLHKINSTSPYTTDSKKFVTPAGFRTVDKTTKWAYLSANVTGLDETIQPREYAILAYELIGSFLLKNFRKVTKEMLDDVQSRLDFTLIESFPFPAPFEEQKYSLDDSQYGQKRDGNSTEETVWIIPGIEYKKYFGF